jgi:hypothetical protein
MIITESIREFQKYSTRYFNGNDIVIIEDGKSHKQKGVFIPFDIYTLFKEELEAAVRKEIEHSFDEDFDGVGAANDR